MRRFRRRKMKDASANGAYALRRLAGLGSVDEVWEAHGDAPVPTILARMRRHPEGVAIEIPSGEWRPSHFLHIQDGALRV